MAKGWTAENAAGERPDDKPEAPRRDADGLVTTRREPERALLAARLPRDDTRLDLPRPLAELALLAKTAGVTVAGEDLVQKRDHPDPATCLGKGAVEELGERLAREGASVVIFDNELAPRQRRNLERLLGKKVIDRTELILDIFASHARTPQARRQVEVAQLEYALPRLRRLWSHLDPGVGLRGPGEKQLEVDKRLVRKRIQELKDELSRFRARKEREVRTRKESFTVALVGYTNAGKSTLMNALTAADVYVADQLFATLDTRTRIWEVGPNRRVLLSDTVGFIRHLPHRLVESFHATLEEVTQADLLLHVVDASDPQPLEQVKAVREVLEQIGAKGREELILLNKIDQTPPELLPYLERRLVNTQRISARSGEGLAALKERINELAARGEREQELLIDVREGRAIALLRAQAELLGEELEDEQLRFHVRCDPRLIGALRAALSRPGALVVVGEELQPEPWE
ncbi:MAG: GTPase HflX [Planctomycetota bacterium]